MQYDIEHEQPITSMEGQQTVQHDVSLSEGDEAGLQNGEVKGYFIQKIAHMIKKPNEVTAIQSTREPGEIAYKHSPLVWRLIAMIGDSSIFGLALILIRQLLYFYPTLFTFQHMPIGWPPTLVESCLALLLWSVAARITQAYEINNLYDRLTSPLCALFAFGIILTFLLIWGEYSFATNSITYFNVLQFYIAIVAPTLCVWRVMLASIMNFPRFRPQAIIVGASEAGKSIARELQRAKRYTANVLGYISVSPTEVEENHKLGLPILGDQHVLDLLARQKRVDMIIMAIDYRTDPDLFQEAIGLAQHGISVVPMTIAYERVSGKVPVEYIGDQWYMALHSEVPISPLYLVWRKVLDVTFGLLGSITLLLLLPVLAPLIYFDSAGPIFYKQARLGRDGCEFIIYKFRSMHTNSEFKGKPQWAAEGDERITRIGRFMRATHLDELPQVFNILRGDMSLIGPRPERQEFVTILENSIPFYRCRLKVKPGLTGWAQVKYGYARSNQDTLEKLQYDLYYIKHQSFMLDIFILLKTVIEVFLHRGA